MITVDGLTVEFGGTTLFKDISFQINEKDRIALMGKNGAGKSTLLKIIAGVRTATRGSVSAPKDCVIAYLPQHLMTEDGRTVFEETCQAFAHLHQIQAEIDRINNELLTRTDYDSDEYMQLIENVSTLSEKFYAIDMTHFEEDVEKTLLGLGFEREDFNRPTSEFSGGWRMRIELAKLLLKSPDVLLLDEPTNHLDIESIGWLEDFICNSSKAVVVISHDRKFVDDITTRTIEVTMGRIYDYKATYSQYLELRKERREQQMKQYEEQQKMIADTKEFIERFKGTYSKTLQVQSRVKMLEKLQLIEVDEEDTSRLRLKFPPSPRSGAYPVQMSDVAMSFDGKNVFSGVNLTVERGDKIAFVGRNGEGKSTLVKCIMGQLQNEGKLELGHNVQIGYFAQNQASLLDGELTVFQTIDDVAKGDVRNKIRDLLGAFMFGGEESTKKVKVLSGGERTRLAILKLLLEPVNLLILDEPTSSLDDKEVQKLFGLMKDLRARGVGIIFVTHFLDQVYEVCDRITVLRDGKLVGEYEIEKLPRVQLVAKMLGKELDDEAQIKDETQVYHADENVPPVFEVEQLQSNAGIKPFDFYIRKGEVNGFTGLLGSGRSECVRAIFGADRIIGGKIKKNGKEIKITKPIDAMKNGIAYLPEDRKVDGIVGDLSVRDNIILAAQVLRGFFRPFSKAQANKFADEYIKLLEIKTASADTPIKSLSGGNQQKVILARWLLTHPEYLILDEPTRGIDIGTKIEIQKLVLKLASEGMSVTFISSETDEMLRTCSRLIVMRDRRKVGEISGEDLTQSKIMDTIAGGEKKNG